MPRKGQLHHLVLTIYLLPAFCCTFRGSRLLCRQLTCDVSFKFPLGARGHSASTVMSIAKYRECTPTRHVPVVYADSTATDLCATPAMRCAASPHVRVNLKLESHLSIIIRF